ncbi:MAG: hypothetical protein KDB27_09020 [Planctomycetales bacterium]|nr:hypothetical protein [Planctomycetales bacterium]
MSTQMSPENEKVPRDAVATGTFASEESALSEAMQLLREKIGESNGSGKELPPEEAVREFDAWVSSHQSRNPNADDSRESLYPDRS